MMNKQELYVKALELWGKPFQILMMIEEMAELTQVLLHDLRKNKTITIHQLADEMADVKIMLEQMMWIYSIHGLVADAEQKKLKKLESYINR